MNPTSLLNQSLQSFREFWTARDARERAMLAAAAAVIIFALVYALLIDPALTGRVQLNKNLPELRQKVAQMQALAKEAAAFSGKFAPPAAMVTKENIDAALARKGLKPLSVIATGDMTKVQLTAASFASTLDWLDEMQKTAQLSVVDANITTLDKPDMVNATLTLRQHRNE